MRTRKKKNGSNLAMFSVCAAIAAAPVIASASTLYWDTNGSTAGAGNPASGSWDTVTPNWNTLADGTGTTVDYTAGSDVVFSAGSDAATAGVTVGTAVTANSLTFAYGSTTLSGATTSGADSITVGAGGISIASGAIATTSTLATGAAGSVSLLVGANQTWTNNGVGTFVDATGGISGAYTLTLNAGNFQIGSGASNGFSGTTGTIDVDGATLIQSTNSGIIGDALVFTAGTYDNIQGKGVGGFTLAGPNFTIANGYKGYTFAGNVTLSAANTNYTLNLNDRSTFTDELVGSEPGQTLTFYSNAGATYSTGVGFADDGKYHPGVVLSGISTSVYNLNGGSMQGSMTLQNGTAVINSANAVSAGGALTSGPTGIGTLHLAGGTLAAGSATSNTIATNVSLDGSLTLGSTSHAYSLFIDGSTLSTPSTVLLTTSPTLTISEPATIADAITQASGGLGFAKAGAATLTLTGVNTYSGATAINAGTLAVNSTSTSAALADTSGITIATTGVLSLVNNSASPNLINDGATITVVGPGSIIDLELNGYQESVASFVVGSTAQPAGVYGSATYFTDSDTVPSSSALADESYFTGDGAINIVPEPATVSVLFAGAMLGLCRRRRTAR